MVVLPAMSANLALALSDLRSLADAKLASIDDLGKQYSDWLTAALNELHDKRQGGADKPSSDPPVRAPHAARGDRLRAVRLLT